MLSRLIRKLNRRQAGQPTDGFTLVEVIVSTAIFITVVSAMLTLFTHTIRINRRVQALREVVQSSRLFTETLAREIRNGRIDYSSTQPQCNVGNYLSSDNQSLAIISHDGDKMCFYIDSSSNLLAMIREAASGTTTNNVFESYNFRIIPETFRFRVLPNTDPNPASTPYPEQQPFVTIVAQFELTGVDTTPTILNYQTTISTDVYDVANEN